MRLPADPGAGRGSLEKVGPAASPPSRNSPRERTVSVSNRLDPRTWPREIRVQNRRARNRTSTRTSKSPQASGAASTWDLMEQTGLKPDQEPAQYDRARYVRQKGGKCRTSAGNYNT